MAEQLADLHIHSNHSDGVLSVAEIVEKAERLGLAAIAITDHDDVSGGIYGRELALKMGCQVKVIPGTEVTARHLRHILALGIEENIVPGLSISETVSQIHDKGGLAIAAHPFKWWWPASLTGDEVSQNSFDGVEGVNVGGTDAHFRTIGKRLTVFEGDDVLEEIRQGRTSVISKDITEEFTLLDLLRNQYAALVTVPKKRFLLKT